jgi:D-3-phosphoglycerate dehydrogenase / 2-oxoglutarate reductase
MSRPKILVTPRSVTRDGHPSLQRLAAAGFEVVFCTAGKSPGADELRKLLPGCVGWLAGVEPVTDDVLAAAPDLRVISRNGVGVDSIDLAAAARRGIAVKKAVGSNARGVAELALAHLLALSRWVTFSDAAIKRGGWERRKGFELAGRTLGIVGCGHIGRIVARLALAFDMRVLGYDLYPDPNFAPSPQFRYAPLAEVFERADVITLHCPALPESKPLIDAAALAAMKRGVCLINTARADLVDNAALLAALASGQVAGVATDVFKTEPPGDDPLARHDRVISTPHLGGFTDESVDRAMEMAVDNLLAELK